ncbi:MAG: TIGR02678 family protein [bacterium]|nr:TIGR02678 family protein [bacterium]
MNNDIEKEMKALLYNFWITKDKNRDLYYQIKNNQSEIKDFISKNLGSNLIIHDKFIKLEKIPTITKSNAKLNNFSSVLEYVILTIMLLFLEDKTKGDYFVLSDLIEYVKNTSITLELNHIPDWNKVQDRRCLSNVISLLEELEIIKIKDSSKVSFIESKEAEVLYESLGTSNYLMRMFDNDINELITPEDFIKDEFTGQDEEKGDVRRYKVFRNILYTPAVSSKDLSSNELDYIKRNRTYIKSEIDKKLNMEVEITNNLTILYDEESTTQKDNFPNSKKLTEIVLMVNEKILEEINNNKIMLDNYEIASVKEDYFENIIKEIKRTKAPYVGKTLLRETDKKFYTMILEYMEKYNIVEKKNDEIIIYPTVARLIGKTKNIEPDTLTQTSLFGGNNEL